MNRKMTCHLAINRCNLKIHGIALTRLCCICACVHILKTLTLEIKLLAPKTWPCVVIGQTGIRPNGWLCCGTRTPSGLQWLWDVPQRPQYSMLVYWLCTHPHDVLIVDLHRGSHVVYCHVDEHPRPRCIAGGQLGDDVIAHCWVCALRHGEAADAREQLDGRARRFTGVMRSHHTRCYQVDCN